MTEIPWTDKGKTWNPWVGCGKVGPECGLLAPGNPQPDGGGCYAIRQAGRGLHPVHAAAVANGDWNGRIIRNTPSVWEQPRAFKSGTLCFTCSMSDFFHEAVPLPMLAEALDVIVETPWVTCQILTKRPAVAIRRLAALGRSLPPNVWMGATIGHPKSLPLLKPLLRIPGASKKFLSVEPLLAPMAAVLDLTGIDWVIVGGESGPNARPMPVEWVVDMRDLCLAKKVPFFFKQWGTLANNPTPRKQELYPHHGGATLEGRLWWDFPNREE
jgi:protein gp37